MPEAVISELSRQLLRAALFDRDGAVAAWEAFKRAGGDIDALEPRRHALLPLVARNFAKHGIDVPERGRLQGVTRRTWYRTRVLADSAGKALDALAEASIPAMLLKGGALLAAYDGDFGAYQMNDIDLLVRPRRAEEAFGVLQAAGWRVSSAHRTDFQRVHRYEHGVGLEDSVRSGLDLHWAAYPMDRGPGADAGLWRRATATEFMGRTTSVPGREDMLVHTLANGARRGGTERWIADAVAVVGSGESLDWRLVEAICAVRKVRTLLAPALTALREDFGANIPADLPRRFLLSDDMTTARRLEGRAWRAHNWRMRRAEMLGARFLDASQPWPWWERPLGFPGFLRFVWKIERDRDIPREMWRWVAAGRGKGPASKRGQLSGR